MTYSRLDDQWVILSSSKAFNYYEFCVNFNKSLIDVLLNTSRKKVISRLTELFNHPQDSVNTGGQPTLSYTIVLITFIASITIDFITQFIVYVFSLFCSAKGDLII